MRYARETFGALLVTAAAILALVLGDRTALLPCGVVAGLAAGVYERPWEAALRGALAGAAGAVAFVVVAAGLVFVRMEPIVGAAFALDPTLFTVFSMLPLLLPLYLVEGALAGPAAAWGSAAVRERFGVGA